MLYLYDKAICEDLLYSFNPDNLDNPVVKVTNPESIVSLAGQIQNDNLSFPIVAVTRLPNYNIKQDLVNFRRLHKGVESVMDTKTNQIYHEKAIPIDLRYDINILTTNTVDMDELLRELLFKYTQMYFLKLRLPYESSRYSRFGVIIDQGSTIERKSSQSEYSESGTLYESVIHLICEGAVLLTYTPVQLKRMSVETELHM